MQLTRVESSMIYAAGYDDTCNQLEIVYFNGIYRYYDVPREIFDGLLDAGSKGQYMHAYVLNQYPYRLLSGRGHASSGAPSYKAPYEEESFDDEAFDDGAFGDGAFEDGSYPAGGFTG